MPVTQAPRSTTDTASFAAGSQPYLAEKRGRAMGSSMHIAATGPQSITEPLLEWAAARIAELEQRWSRFIATSEVSRLNAAAGTAVPVSADTFALVQRALEARTLSQGKFDPTLLQAMQANGYDRTFVSIKTPVGLPALDTRRIGLGQVTLDAATSTVTLGPTTGFDPGGIGKGLAADLVAEEMIHRGALGALVNLGGDVRCIGHGPAAGSWIVAVGDHAAGVPNRVVEIAAGGIASSTRSRRTWKRRDGDQVTDTHHLLDPATGQASARAANLATVIAGTCADAEWLATSIAAEGMLPAAANLGNASVMLTDHEGSYVTAGAPERFVR